MIRDVLLHRPRATACVLILLAACSSAAPRARTTPTSAPHQKSSTPTVSRSHVASAGLPNLPYVVERAAGAVVGGTGYILGGLVPGDRSITPILSIDLSSGLARRVATLPTAAHDAAAAALGDNVYLFGGSGTAGNLVQRFDPATGTVTRVGTLPRMLSDLGAVAIGNTIYVIGGYDGARARREILATTDERTFTTAAMLPQGLRYMAVAAIGSKILVVGGQTDSAQASSRILLIEPSTGSVRRLGTLSMANAHAVLVVRGGTVFVVGGRDAAGRPTDRVWRVSLSNGSATAAAPLPIPLADTTILAGAQRTLLAGGATGDASQGGETNKEILFTDG
jgi:N-acetylneuraminic acid mutarotase